MVQLLLAITIVIASTGNVFYHLVHATTIDAFIVTMWCELDMVHSDSSFMWSELDMVPDSIFIWKGYIPSFVAMPHIH